MNKTKCVALIVCGGMLMQVASCAADLGTLLVDVLVASLPDLLDAALGTTTTTTA